MIHSYFTSPGDMEGQAEVGGISPTRVEYQLRMIEGANKAVTSRLTAVETGIKTHEGLLREILTEMKKSNKADDAGSPAKTVEQAAKESAEGSRHQTETARMQMEAQFMTQMQTVYEEKQREIAEVTASLTQKYTDELYEHQKRHKGELEEQQRQTDMAKARELSEQAEKAQQEKDKFTQDLYHRCNMELQKRQQEFEGQIAAMTTEMEALKQREKEHISKLKSLQGEVTKKDHVISSLQTEVTKQQTAFSGLLKTVSEKNEEVKKLMAENKRTYSNFQEEKSSLQKHFKQKLEKKLESVRVEYESRLLAAETNSEDRGSLSEDREEIERLRTRLKEEQEKNEPPTCCVCMEREPNAFLMPCGHRFCMVCATHFENTNGRCALCRSRFEMIGTLQDN